MYRWMLPTQYLFEFIFIVCHPATHHPSTNSLIHSSIYFSSINKFIICISFFCSKKYTHMYAYMVEENMYDEKFYMFLCEVQKASKPVVTMKGNWFSWKWLNRFFFFSYAYQQRYDNKDEAYRMWGRQNWACIWINDGENCQF